MICTFLNDCFVLEVCFYVLIQTCLNADCTDLFFFLLEQQKMLMSPSLLVLQSCVNQQALLKLVCRYIGILYTKSQKCASSLNVALSHTCSYQCRAATALSAIMKTIMNSSCHSIHCIDQIFFFSHSASQWQKYPDKLI